MTRPEITPGASDGLSPEALGWREAVSNMCTPVVRDSLQGRVMRPKRWSDVLRHCLALQTMEWNDPEELPHVPTEHEWQALLDAAAQESLRNRAMFAVAYSAALDGRELTAMKLEYIQAGCLSLPAHATKNKRPRKIDLAWQTQELLNRYLQYRCSLSRDGDFIWLSESTRNRGEPITEGTWNDIVRTIASRAGAPWFRARSLRHLCLVDLACSGASAREPAAFLNHKTPRSVFKHIFHDLEPSSVHQPPSRSQYDNRMQQLFDTLSK